VAGHDAFGQRLLQHFDRIAQVQGPERRRDLQGAFTEFVDRMTPCAVGARDREAPLHARRSRDIDGYPGDNSRSDDDLECHDWPALRYGLNINVVTWAGIDLPQSLAAAGRSASWHRLIEALGNSQF